MKKYIVVSSNNNPDYYHYAKYLERAWNKLGWNLCVMITADVNPLDLELSNPESIYIQLPEIPGLRKETVAQASRLYAANYLPLDALIMTSDMDLLPLSDYWHPSPDAITVYGHDLTDYTYIPMGYVVMLGSKWKQVMNLSYNTTEDLLRDCQEFGSAFSDQWEKWWNVDWEILTARLKRFTNEITFVKRGRGHSSFAYGRVDRGDGMVVPDEILIDAHCENNNSQHPEKLAKFLNLFEPRYGKL